MFTSFPELSSHHPKHFTTFSFLFFPHHLVCFWKQILNITNREIKKKKFSGKNLWQFWNRDCESHCEGLRCFPTCPVHCEELCNALKRVLVIPSPGKTQESDFFQSHFVCSNNKRIPYLISVCPPAFRAIWTSSFPYLSSACALLKEKLTQFLLVLPGSHLHKSCNCIWGAKHQKCNFKNFSIYSILMLLVNLWNILGKLFLEEIR